MSQTHITLYPTSLEYIFITVSADTTLEDLTGIDIALVPLDTTPDADTIWYPATWQGEVATTREARIKMAGPLASSIGEDTLPVPDSRNTSVVFIRISDNPETIIRSAGLVILDR